MKLLHCILGSIVLTLTTMSEGHINAYLIPGQGADERMFEAIQLDSNYVAKPIQYCTPTKDKTLPEYAHILAEQIDTTKPFILIGVSLGGMLAVEMSTFLKPEKVILISSAKNRKEIPLRYRIFNQFPLHEIIPSKWIKQGAFLAQPLVEPDSKGKEVFDRMLLDKDPDYLKHTIAMIVGWDREETPPNIIHIHGTSDNTLPYRLVKADYTIEGGSHMMVMTKADEVNAILKKIL